MALTTKSFGRKKKETEVKIETKLAEKDGKVYNYVHAYDEEGKGYLKKVEVKNGN